MSRCAESGPVAAGRHGCRGLRPRPPTAPGRSPARPAPTAAACGRPVRERGAPPACGLGDLRASAVVPWLTADPHPGRPERRPDAVRVPAAKVALSTASVYPENTATAFEIAARLGYDGVEVMVWTDPVSQDIDALRRLSDYHGVPILAVHAPCLLITQRVWGTDPWAKLVNGPARRPRSWARPPWWCTRRSAGSASTPATSSPGSGGWPTRRTSGSRSRTCTPGATGTARCSAYAPDWDPTKEDYRHFTVDLSHAATSRTDTLAMVGRMGDRLAHVHLADGSGSAKDEHLVPGPRHAALRRAAGAAGRGRLRRPRGASRSTPARRDVRGRARGRPRRGAGLHPAAPGRAPPRPAAGEPSGPGRRRPPARAAAAAPRAARPARPGTGSSPRPARSSPPGATTGPRSVPSARPRAWTRRWCTTTSGRRSRSSPPPSSCRSRRRSASRRR